MRRRVLLLIGCMSLAMLRGGSIRSQPDAADQARVKELGEFTNRFKITNRYVLIPAGLSEAELIAIAKRLHRSEPKATYWFLDDDSQFPKLLASLKEIEAGNSENYPSDWAGEHIVANLQEWLGGGGRRWVLCKGSGIDQIAEIE
jgi:hypothetical protein